MDDELGLEQLKLFKQAFDNADDDGSGELDIEEFCEQLGPYLGKDLSKEEISQLFMKIDTDADGTIDWEEFSNFMFLQRAENDEDNAESWRLFPMDIHVRGGRMHSEPVEKVLVVPDMDKYITIGRDAAFRVWQPHNLSLTRTVQSGVRWLNDIVYLRRHKQLVVASMDRSLAWYEINRGAYECIGKLHTAGTMGAPTCVSSISLIGNTPESVMYGDSNGMVYMILANTTEAFASRDMLYTDHTHDYVCLHDKHRDWVTKVQHIEDVGLVTASQDSKIFIFDVNRDGVMQEVSHHAKGVHDFAYCRPYSLFASASERSILLWQAQTGRLISELSGHTAVVSALAVDNDQCQLISLSTDHVIKLWDLRTNKCVQTVAEDDWPKGEEQPVAMAYDGVRKRLITAAKRPYLWEHKLVMRDASGHRGPCARAMYNSAFFVVVSADESGCIICWNLNTGERQSRFLNAHGAAKLTAIAFDSNERRLLSAGDDGRVKIWNFNNGSLLREYRHGEAVRKEVTCVAYVHDAKRDQERIYAAGWNRKVFVWEDVDEDTVEECKAFDGHKDDILCMAVSPDGSQLATGDYEGRIVVWNLHTGEKRLALFHRSDRYENAVTALVWMHCGAATALGYKPTMLVSAGADGVVRVWRVAAEGLLMCTLQGAVGPLDTVKALCTDAEHAHLVVADSSGHVKVLHVPDLDATTPQRAMASFTQVSHFRVSELAVNSVTCVAGRRVLLAACQDCGVYVYTHDGAFVGTFGEHAWDIDDPATWQGASSGRPLPVLDGLDLLARAAEVYKAQDEGAEEEEEAELKPWEGTQPVQFYLKARRERINASMASLPREAVHGLLRVQPAVELPRTIQELMGQAPKGAKRAGRLKSAAGAPAAGSGASADKGA